MSKKIFKSTDLNALWYGLKSVQTKSPILWKNAVRRLQTVVNQHIKLPVTFMLAPQNDMEGYAFIGVFTHLLYPKVVGPKIDVHILAGNDRIELNEFFILEMFSLLAHELTHSKQPTKYGFRKYTALSAAAEGQNNAVYFYNELEMDAYGREVALFALLLEHHRPEFSSAKAYASEKDFYAYMETSNPLHPEYVALFLQKTDTKKARKFYRMSKAWVEAERLTINAK